MAAVKAPGYGDRRKAMMDDIAVLTGGKAIFKDLGIDLENIQLADLGTRQEGHDRQREHHDRRRRRHRRRTSRAASTDPPGDRGQPTSDYDREKLQERLAKLAGGIAQINVGAATETEMKERKARSRTPCTRPAPPSKKASSPAAAPL